MQYAKSITFKSTRPSASGDLQKCQSGCDLLGHAVEYCLMASSAQVELWNAEKVATQVAATQAPNAIHYAMWGETRVSDADLERLVGAVPATLSGALEHRAYYLVPLAIADTGETMVAPGYTVDLGARRVDDRTRRRAAARRG